ncbi:MAG: zf-HC2 domain-containing protein [Thermoanaerobaculia bacterium]
MNCEKVSGLLFDYEDSGLNADDLDSVREHLKACHSCNRELKSVRSLMIQARDLRSGSAPPRDLWPEISSRLENTPQGHEVQAQLPARSARGAMRVRTRRWNRLGIAAALGFLALLVPMTIRWIGSGLGSEATLEIPADAQPAGRAALQYRADQLSDAAIQARVEYGVLQTKRDLLVAIERERSVLGPEAFAQIRSSIQQVDRAIGETRVALENFPESRQLNHHLAALYMSESELLKRLSRV